MIIFEKIRYKNLIGVGNAPVEIDICRNKTTLVIGVNGQGKSTFLEAISFALFGTPFRKIKKALLINSINKKQCLVEIWFSIGTHKYYIKRGIKPDIFEIYIDDKKLEQVGSTIDYQNMLESSILQMNQKTFNQVVLLSTVHIKPFMQMEAKERRDVIEDILDIRIFTEMNKVLKRRKDSIKEKVAMVEGNIDVQKRKIEIQTNYINTLKADNKKKKEELSVSVNEIDKNIQTLEHQISLMQTDLDSLHEKISDRDSITQKKTKISNFKAPLSAKIKALQETVDFYSENDVCPTCSQQIEGEVKEHQIKKSGDKISEINIAIEKLHIQLNDIADRETEIRNIITIINEKQQEINQTNNQIRVDQGYLRRIMNELNSLNENSGNLDNEEEKLVDYNEAVTNLLRQKSELSESNQYIDVAATLLKDSGIKTLVINQYLPVINKLINQYLATMDIWISFHLDGEFNETIKSRDRDSFTYYSFSEGEKQRIDLAILFTWRTIAKMKNSVSCNLLVFDEVLDKALDQAGTEQVVSLLNTLGDNTNVFVISHKVEELQDKFRGVIKFEKVNNFTQISQSV